VIGTIVRLKNRLRVTMICIAVLSSVWPFPCEGYSVLTHEAIIDTAWDTHIRPLLLQRFPNSTPDELRQTHAYAYGGCDHSRHGVLTPWQ